MSQNLKEKTKKSQNAIVPAASIEEEKKTEFLKKLKESLGLVNVTLDACDIDYQTLQRWNNDSDFSIKFTEATEYAGDFVERMLFKKIQEGDTQAIVFYCETKLRNRGYYKK